MIKNKIHVCSSMFSNEYFYKVSLKLAHQLLRNCTDKNATDRRKDRRTDTVAPMIIYPPRPPPPTFFGGIIILMLKLGIVEQIVKLINITVE